MVQTWTDPWLNVQPPRPPRIKNTNQWSHPKVHDLFLNNHKAWDQDKVIDLVHQDNAIHVLSLKLSQTQNCDYLGWHETESGLYTVKSGYWLRCHLSDTDQVQPAPGNIRVKSEIWKLHMAPKIKHFLWRVMSRALATGAELDRRHIINDNTCKRCFGGSETTDHSFLLS